MDRKEAIEILGKSDLENMTSDQRAEQLEIMALEAWEYNNIPDDIAMQMEAGELKYKPEDSRYDCVLMMWIRCRYNYAQNNYLKECLNNISINVDIVTGNYAELIPCPCCGYQTLGSRGEYQICSVCWWEDDGQDDADADETKDDGTEYSLSQARENFYKHTISFHPSDERFERIGRSK